MDFHDFPRFLGKSEIWEVEPPSPKVMCMAKVGGSEFKQDVQSRGGKCGSAGVLLRTHNACWLRRFSRGPIVAIRAAWRWRAAESVHPSEAAPFFEYGGS